MTEKPVSSPELDSQADSEYQLGYDREHPIPSTGVVIFDGDSFLAFRFGDETTVGGKWGIPGGHNEIDPEFGEIESCWQTGPREIREETSLITNSDWLTPFNGNEFVKDMSKNGQPKWMKWTVLYTHEFSGTLESLQPHEGSAAWMMIQDFFDLPDEEVAPNAKLALIYALIHTANS
jgi:ADP-ribose pyrophosphatase YjhB (NUDIX family)